MDYLNLIIGLVLIGVGFLGKAFPFLIAGYNVLPDNKKKNIDEKGFLIAFRNGMILIGLAVIIGYYFFKWVGIPTIADYVAPVVIVLGIITLSLYALRFKNKVGKEKKNSNNRKVLYIILAISLTFMIGSTLFGSYPAKTIITADSIKFTGMYGLELNPDQIEKVEVIQQIPKILKRTNGFSFLTTRKGYFELADLGQCRLLLHSNNSPYMIISKRNGEQIIFNAENSAKTLEVSNSITSIIK